MVARPADAASSLEKELRNPPVDPALVKVPPYEFVMIDGSGDPNTSPVYVEAVSALYSYSYPVVITLKKAGRVDLKVGSLEGLWWAENFAAFQMSQEDRTKWRWTMMIRQPSGIPAELHATVLAKIAKKLGQSVADRLRFETFHEGTCVQLMHTGPYIEEGPNIARLHDYATSLGCNLRGHHHEIYLSDPRKTAAPKLRTILRQPVQRAS